MWKVIAFPFRPEPSFRSSNWQTASMSRVRCVTRPIHGFRIFLLVTLAVISGDPSRAFAEVTEEQAKHFRDKVLPLLESRCFECHGDQDDIEAELRLTSRKAMLQGGESGPVIVPGDPDRSLLIQAIRYESFQMPPRSKMPDDEIRILAEWIKEDAPWPDDDKRPANASHEKSRFPLEERKAAHWAWKPITVHPAPQVNDVSWPDDDIDRFLLAKMEREGLTPAPDADRRALLRRLCFDLTGLPPTLEQQERFFNDPGDTRAAITTLVDELLASPHFGEHWTRQWLDLVRYAETLGHEFDYPLPYAWRYRDYVIRALNQDLPYDQFVREHIAGDLLPSPRRHAELGFNESIIATGFWYLCEDKHAPVDVKGEEALRIDNQIDVFGKAFLGLTIACARCHDHKFDAITAEDYYALSGFLQSSRRRVEWLDDHQSTAKLVTDLLYARQVAQSNLQSAANELDTARLKNLVRQLFDENGFLMDTAPEADLRPEATTKNMLRTWLRDPSSTSLSHPLSMLASITQRPPEQSLADAVKAWEANRTQIISLERESDVSALAEAARPESSVFARFNSGFPDGWFAFGPAFFPFLDATQQAVLLGLDTGDASPENLWTQAQAVIDADGQASTSRLQWTSGARMTTRTGSAISSAELSPRLTGSLHSPEFELRHPEIQILAAGESARVRLVIDGYVMNEFSELLFSGCRQPINTEGQFRWIRMSGDVSRYLGHRCHLEFLDDGDGWFAVQEVRFGAQTGQAVPPVTDISPANRVHTIPNDISVDSLVNAWSDAVSTDPNWHLLVADSPLVPENAAAEFRTAATRWKQLAAVEQKKDHPVLVMCEGTGEDERLFVRGNHRNLGPSVSRHLLTALDQSRPLDNPAASGRLELADRLLSADNPFPSRVIVNRIWQQLYGRGLVASSDNFGVLGEAPSHPELLDMLAREFQQDGWSIKRLIRRLTLTRAYRLSAARNDTADQKDPTNRLLHRFTVRRLPAETIRDAILTISGRLDPSSFGPSVPVHLSSFMQGRGRPAQSGPLDGNGRRSIYQSVNRNFLNPFMLAFDTPQPATAVGRRSTSNVPAQALLMLNNEFVHQQSEVWAQRLISSVDQTRGSPAETTRRILELAFRQAFCRTPDDTEMGALLQFARDFRGNAANQEVALNRSPAALKEICHVLLNQKEFLFLD
jgi:hypothetical protein